MESGSPPDAEALERMSDRTEELYHMLWAMDANADDHPQFQPTRRDSGEEPSAYDLVSRAAQQILTAMGARNLERAVEEIGDGSSPLEAVTSTNAEMEASDGEQ